MEQSKAVQFVPIVRACSKLSPIRSRGRIDTAGNPRGLRRDMVAGAILAVIVPMSAVSLLPHPASASSPSNHEPEAISVARQGTPVSPVVPDPSECRIEPRSLEDVLALYATPQASVAGQPSPAASPAPTELPPELPDGPPVDTATAAAVSAVWREAYACLNANDYLRLAALTDSDSLQRILGTNPTVEEFAADVLSSRPRPMDERELLPPLSGLRVLPDGRVGGLIDLGPPEAPEYAGKNHVIFVREGDRWLMDEVVAIIG